jgi:hypothetical protein
MLDNFFALKNRELELKYGNNNRANPGNIPAKIPVNQMKQNTGIDTNNHIYQEQYKTLAYMFDNGQSDQANEVLAALFKTNKALYDQLCTDLNLEDSE